MPRCSTCKVEKDAAEFHKSARTKNGYANACKSCMREYKRVWYYENGGKNYEEVYAKRYSKQKVERTSKWKRSNPERRIWQTAKKRALDRGIEFNIGWADVVIPKTCPVLGIDICTTNKNVSADSPSLDRIDNSRGYVVGNVQVISHRANSLKNNLTLEQAERLVSYMRYRK